ncbi:MAG: hypothetical protein LBI82_03735 [Dysgonamonadaceae bacterium]|jgi:hypothetical protein|nr:hypothetical protein [Dysgonamonadaceae bacterium]
MKSTISRFKCWAIARLVPAILCLFLATAGIRAQQTYPIYVTPQLMPPYSLTLSDYSQIGSQRLVVTIMVRDVTVTNLPVRLHLKIENMSGVTIESIPTAPVTPIFLSGGEVSILFGDDMRDYFNINNLQFKGFSKDEYRRTGQLPEGFYRFTVEVRHAATGRLISNRGTAMAWIALGKPPVLKAPDNNAELGQIMGMPLTFSWMPSNVGVPTGGIQYTFEMWEMRVPGIPPSVVAASMPVFYSTTQMNTNLVIHPVTLMLEPGMNYAWRVTASDVMGQVPFAQKGQSEVRSFIYQCRCDEATNLSVERRGQDVTYRWNPSKDNTSYNIEIENPVSGWSKSERVFDTKYEFKSDPDKTYRLRVQAICQGNEQNPSGFTAWKSITIPESKPVERGSDCECGKEFPERSLTNHTLRTDLQPGDTIETRSGDTRFIIKTVNKQSDDTYSGVFLFWWEYYGIKIVCNYWDLQVNTDNWIIRYNFESVYDPQFMVDVDAAKEYLNQLGDAVATLTTNTTIKDSVKIDAPLEGAYVKEGQLIVINSEGKEEVYKLDDKPNGTLITGSDGEEYVLTSDGKMVGKDEFAATGGNNRLTDNYNKEKESKAQPSVTFSASSQQQWGFDAYENIKSAIQNEYPELRPGFNYRPAFKSIASFKLDKVLTNGNNNITYRTEMGVAPMQSGETLTLRGSSDGDETILYAYNKQDSTETVVGKLNLLSFDEQTKQVYLISVNSANLPNANTLQTELNRIYAPAITQWNVAEKQGIQVSFPDGKMTHGGSGALSVYNADQKNVIKTFEQQREKFEKDALYLFFVNNVENKDGGNVTGYMPLQYQSGFIYHNNTNPTSIAHELAHGAFSLYHTFSNDKYIAAQNATDNLMDYKNGEELWKHQWKEIHNPKNSWFKFLQNEEEGEKAIVKNTEALVDFKNTDGTYTFISLSGKPITLKELPKEIRFSTGESVDLESCEDEFKIVPFGAVTGFTLQDGTNYAFCATCKGDNFVGYFTGGKCESAFKYIDIYTNPSIKKAIVGLPYVENNQIVFKVGQISITPITGIENYSYSGKYLLYDELLSSKITEVSKFNTVYTEFYPKYDLEVTQFIVKSFSEIEFNGKTWNDNAGYIFIHATQLQEKSILKGCFKTGVPGSILKLILEKRYYITGGVVPTYGEYEARVFSDDFEKDSEKNLAQAKLLVNSWKKYDVNYYNYFTDIVNNFQIPDNATAKEIYNLLSPYAKNLNTDNWDCIWDKLTLDKRIYCINTLIDSKFNSAGDYTEEIIALLITTINKEEDIKNLFTKLEGNTRNYNLLTKVLQVFEPTLGIFGKDEPSKLKVIYKLTEWKNKYYPISNEEANRIYKDEQDNIIRQVNRLSYEMDAVNVRLFQLKKETLLGSSHLGNLIFNVGGEIDSNNGKITITTKESPLSSRAIIPYHRTYTCNPFDWVIIEVVDNLPEYGLEQGSRLYVPAILLYGIGNNENYKRLLSGVRLGGDALAILLAPFTAGGSTTILYVELGAATIDIGVTLYENEVRSTTLGEIGINAWNVSYALWNTSLAIRSLANILKFETATVGGLTRPTRMQVLVNQVFQWSEEAVSNTDKIKLVNNIDNFIVFLRTTLKEGKLTNAADIVEVQASISKLLEIKLKIENSITTVVPIVVDRGYLVVQGVSVGEIALSDALVVSINSPRMLPVTVTTSKTIATINKVTLLGTAGQTVDIVENGGQYYLKVSTKGGVVTTPVGKYSINEISKQKGFEDLLPELLQKGGLTMDDFRYMMLKNVNALTDSEKAKLAAIRNALPKPDANTVMQKVISKSDIQKYIKGDYSDFGGSVTRASDAKHLKSFEDLYFGERLDYPNSPFSIEDGSCGVIRFSSNESSNAIITSGNAFDNYAYPFTSTGFTSGNNDRLGVPEWNLSKRIGFSEGDEIWEIFNNGTEKLRAIYGKDSSGILRIIEIK